MSDRVQPELQAFHELKSLVRNLADELAAFRKRALLAEARVKELEATGGAPDPGLAARVAELEAENARLRERFTAAGTRTRQMLERVRFLRQQADLGVER